MIVDATFEEALRTPPIDPGTSMFARAWQKVLQQFAAKTFRLTLSGFPEAITLAGVPTSKDVPVGCYAVVKNTGDSTVKLYYNDAGVMKKVALA